MLTRINYLLTALALQAQFGSALEGVLPQAYSEEARLKMLFENYGKYNAHLDFENGFQQT